jgi:5-methylthioadenosine/S-adenosylhomocysteine deaminase
MMPDLVIKNCNILRLENGEVKIDQNQDIFIRGNRIAAIRPVGELNPGAQDEAIAGTGLLAIPGFINTHAHIPMVLFRGLAEDVSIISGPSNLICCLRIYTGEPF